MTTIKFANGKTLEATPFGSTALFQGIQRSVLELKVAEDAATYDELFALYTDSSALSAIEITETDDNGETVAQSVHLNYTLPMELALNDCGEEKRLWRMKVAQKSALELAQEKQAAEINDAQLALIELAGLIGGNNNV